MQVAKRWDPGMTGAGAPLEAAPRESAGRAGLKGQLAGRDFAAQAAMLAPGADAGPMAVAGFAPVDNGKPSMREGGGNSTEKARAEWERTQRAMATYYGFRERHGVPHFNRFIDDYDAWEAGAIAARDAADASATAQSQREARGLSLEGTRCCNDLKDVIAAIDKKHPDLVDSEHARTVHTWVDDHVALIEGKVAAALGFRY